MEGGGSPPQTPLLFTPLNLQIYRDKQLVYLTNLFDTYTKTYTI